MSDTPENPSGRTGVSGFVQRLRARLGPAMPFLSGVLATFAALGLYNALFPAPPALTLNDVNAAAARVMASVTPAPANSALAYAAVRASLVFIESNVPNDEGDFKDAIGSGVVVNDRGDILTSLHVVANASKIEVTFPDGTRSAAQVTKEDPEHDIAVLQALTPPAQIVPAVLGNPAGLRVGDEAFVVANPIGLYGSMTAGVISGLDRTFNPKNDRVIEGLIQIDAAVNPGSSGGPLVNRYGQVVGIVAALVNPSGEESFAGIGFAVPINVAGGAAGAPAY